MAAATKEECETSLAVDLQFALHIKASCEHFDLVDKKPVLVGRLNDWLQSAKPETKVNIYPALKMLVENASDKTHAVMLQVLVANRHECPRRFMLVDPTNAQKLALFVRFFEKYNTDSCNIHDVFNIMIDWMYPFHLTLESVAPICILVLDHVVKMRLDGKFTCYFAKFFAKFAKHNPSEMAKAVATKGGPFNCAMKALGISLD